MVGLWPRSARQRAATTPALQQLSPQPRQLNRALTTPLQSQPRSGSPPSWTASLHAAALHCCTDHGSLTGRLDCSRRLTEFLRDLARHLEPRGSAPGGLTSFMRPRNGARPQRPRWAHEAESRLPRRRKLHRTRIDISNKVQKENEPPAVLKAMRERSCSTRARGHGSDTTVLQRECHPARQRKEESARGAGCLL